MWPAAGESSYPKAVEDKETEKTVAGKPTPAEFLRQVRAETSKVVWPTRKETITTAIMVLIMTSILAIFFLGTDSLFSSIVQWLLSLLS